jgi:hypothetical protein
MLENVLFGSSQKTHLEEMARQQYKNREKNRPVPPCNHLFKGNNSD